MDAQLKKGLLEFCVLAVLEGGDSYGYQMIKDISPYVHITESTLYPILRRMGSSGYVSSYKEMYQHRTRKYFQLTEAGHEYLNTFRLEKQEIYKILEFIEKGLNYE